MLKALVISDPETFDRLKDDLSSLGVRWESAASQTQANRLGRKSSFDIALVDEDCGFKITKPAVPFIVLSSRKNAETILEAKRRGAMDVVLKPYNVRELIMRFNAVAHRKIRIACIGGGTGLFTLLLGLKSIPNALLTSVVNMSDDGGSSGKLTHTFGILPPGDVRRSLVALSNAPELMNQIIQHRFEKGGELHGHSFGNIFLTALAEVKGSMAEAVRSLGEILNVQGIVLPATRSLTSLNARFTGGRTVRGESKIDLAEGRDPGARVQKVWLDPVPEGNPDAFSAILNADLVTIGPGDLFTSVISNLLVGEVRAALLKTKSKVVYVCNLMTKPGETAGFDAVDHVREIVKYLGRDALDAVIVSNTALSEESVGDYAKKDQVPVRASEPRRFSRYTKARVLFADVGSQTELVRHDSQKLAFEIKKIIYNK